MRSKGKRRGDEARASEAEAAASEQASREAEAAASEEAGHARVRVRLPGFVKDEEIGLGDVVTRATYSVGIRPCGGCGRRAAALNRWVAFTR